MRRTVLAAITALAVLVGSCGGTDESDDRSALVYAAIIRSLVPPPDDASPDDPVTVDVFVWGGEDRSIPLEVQAAVVQELDDYTAVRFVDERDEAIDDDETPQQVRNDGYLVTLGPVPPRGDTVEVDATVEVGEHRDSYEIRLEGDASGWTIIAPPRLRP